MDGHTISQVAELTGFSPSALRFYEGAGLIQPARTPAGYRTYDQAGIDTLRFIARAKRLGLRLDDIRDLVALLDDQRCRPVQQRLRALLHDQIDEGQQQIATLIAFVAQLRQAAARLDGSTPEGACDDTCGCTTDSPAGAPGVSGVSGPTAVTLGAAPAPAGEPPIACTLGPAELPDRIGAWQAALRAADRPGEDRRRGTAPPAPGHADRLVGVAHRSRAALLRVLHLRPGGAQRPDHPRGHRSASGRTGHPRPGRRAGLEGSTKSIDQEAARADASALAMEPFEAVRTLRARPDRDSVQISHLLGSYCHQRGPLR